MTAKPTKDLRQLIHDAQRAGLDDEAPDRSIDVIATQCCVNRAHLFDLMAGKPDPSKVKAWTIHRIAKGLDLDPDVVRAAVALSRAKAQRKARRETSLLD